MATSGVRVGPDSLIARVLPPDIAAAELVGPAPDAAAVHPDEEPLLAKAAPKRRDDFARGRTCARLALGQLDPALGAVPILKGDQREPLWPAGVVGAITHCRGYAAAAAALTTTVASVGIDAEPAEALPDGIAERIMTAAERDAAAALAPLLGPAWDRFVFCAKEAVYKAWFPRAQRWLGFLDAVVLPHPDPAAHQFTVELLVDGLEVHGSPIRRLHGRFAHDLDQGVLVAAVAVSRPIG